MAEDKEPVTIKKYANRRLYNTGTSTYVTLEDLATMVKDGEDFVVYDAKSGDDITRSVLAQIIFEQENKEGQSLLPITFLRQTLCLDTRYRRRQGCAPVTASGWAHHPYDLRGSPLESSSHKLVTIASLGKLTTALARAAKANATTRRLPVYVTEYGVETVPDASNGVSFGVQAAWSCRERFCHRISFRWPS